MSRQPVIILRRSHRVDMEASVFPLVRPAREVYPTVEAAMHHGTFVECERWCADRAADVELLGTADEIAVRGAGSWQGSIYARLAQGHVLPESCTWRPPEEIERDRKDAAIAEGQARVRALSALMQVRDLASDMVTAIAGEGVIDASEVGRMLREAKDAVERHQTAHARMMRTRSE